MPLWGDARLVEDYFRTPRTCIACVSFVLIDTSLVDRRFNAPLRQAREQRSFLYSPLVFRIKFDHIPVTRCSKPSLDSRREFNHPKYALIMCSNRDEFLTRPTTPAHWHSFDNENDGGSGSGAVLSGRDLLAGGTWAGITRIGRVALLTNITEPHGRYSSSRGDLTSSFLLAATPPATLHEEIDRTLAQDKRYAGFNLLLLCPARPIDHGDGRALSLDAAFLTNSGGGGKIKARPLDQEERRCGALSNGIDHHGAAEWPKVRRGSQMFQDILNCLGDDAPDSDLTERLFDLLTWKSEIPPSDRTGLRNTIQVEPLQVPIQKSPDDTAQEPYGTRLSTVILIRRDGNVLFIERDIWILDQEGIVKKAEPKQQRIHRFQICIEDDAKE